MEKVRQMPNLFSFKDGLYLIKIEFENGESTQVRVIKN